MWSYQHKETPDGSNVLMCSPHLLWENSMAGDGHSFWATWLRSHLGHNHQRHSVNSNNSCHRLAFDSQLMGSDSKIEMDKPGGNGLLHMADECRWDGSICVGVKKQANTHIFTCEIWLKSLDSWLKKSWLKQSLYGNTLWLMNQVVGSVICNLTCDSILLTWVNLC